MMKVKEEFLKDLRNYRKKVTERLKTLKLNLVNYGVKDQIDKKRYNSLILQLLRLPIEENWNKLIEFLKKENREKGLNINSIIKTLEEIRDLGVFFYLSYDMYKKHMYEKQKEQKIEEEKYWGKLEYLDLIEDKYFRY
jgi:hypothetical protein